MDNTSKEHIGKKEQIGLKVSLTFFEL